ncbi:MAG: arylamine N-acetyltransferase [Thermoanaerobaculia bacterium]|nr:arylamine N-acetyltransferase [Thermoanaerobaculia bacterium]
MNDEARQAYLSRIGWNVPVAPNSATLAALHEAHLLAVPFENLDIGLGREIVLDLERLHDKIVTRRRGGFCYELNGLFASLLAGRGFDLDLLSARVADDAGVLGPEFDHMALLVRAGGKRWLADVGFGDSFRRPIDLDDASPQAGGDPLGRAWSVRDDGDELALLQHEADGVSRVTYAFTLAPRELAHYAPMCVWQQTSPESSFTRRRVCSRATPQGRVTLANDRLIVTTPGGRTERLVAEGERAAVLLREFGVAV